MTTPKPPNIPSVWWRETGIENILLFEKFNAPSPANLQKHVTYEYIARALPQAREGACANVGFL